MATTLNATGRLLVFQSRRVRFERLFSASSTRRVAKGAANDVVVLKKWCVSRGWLIKRVWVRDRTDGGIRRRGRWLR